MNHATRFCTVLAAATLTLLLAAGAGWGTNPSNKVFVLGDSLSDTGNLYELTQFWPPSPPYTQRFSNGPVWPEHFSTDMGIPVASLAYGGAFSGTFVVNGVPASNLNDIQYPDLFQGHPGIPEEVEMLLSQFPEGLDPDALYVVWVGPNDFFLGLLDPGQMPAILEATVSNIAAAVCTLAAHGARHFAVGNLPDIGLTPFAATLPPEQQAVISPLIAQFNAGLGQVLTTLQPICAESLVILDSYQILHDAVNNPAAYGLTNVSDACLGEDWTVCPDPDGYLFWDSLHPTTVGHAIFADRFRSSFCGTGLETPGLRGKPSAPPPPVWRGVCYGTP